MANITSQAIVMKSLDDTTTTNLTTFHKFGELPAELRLKIFKMSLTPRRIVLMRAAHRPRLSLSDATLLFVNWEANQVFRENYTKCFHEFGQKGIYINFDIDTLCFKTAIKGFRKMVRQYPGSMSKIKFIDVKSQHRGHYNEQLLPIDLTALKSLQKLTIRWNMGEYQRRGPDTDEMCDAFAYLTVALQKAAEAGTWKPSNMPKAAMLVVVGDVESWPRNPSGCYEQQGKMYLEPRAHLTHASYGRIREEDEILRDFQVDWIEQNVPLEIEVDRKTNPDSEDYISFNQPLVERACKALEVFMSYESQRSHAVAMRAASFDTEQERIKIHTTWIETWNRQINASPAQRADTEYILSERRLENEQRLEDEQRRRATVLGLDSDL